VADEEIIIPRLDPESKQPVLDFKFSAAHEESIREIKRMLGLDQKLSQYRVNSDFVRSSPDTVSIRTRTLMSIFFYLSQHVDVPKAHKDAGLVTVTRNRDGSEFDWGETPAGRLFHIRQSDEQPDLAFLAIPYRGQWFYVPDNDLESKSTFMLISQLFRLQAGAAKSAGPTLTIPVR
jgi:hypothetical protein